MITTVLSMSMVVAPQAGATASAGDLIKMDGLSSVYYLGADNKRYVFPNEQTYFSWYSDWSSVVTVPQSELEGYALAANVTIRSGTKLVKITTDPTVYAVEPGGTLRSIVSETNAINLWGADWATKVVDVPDSFFTNYTVGTVLAEGVYPSGSLVKASDSVDVYYYDGTNYRVFSSETSFTGNRFSFDNVITVPDTVTVTAGGTEVAASEFIDTSEGAGGVAGAGTGLTVALASDTPASATVITNTTATTGNGQANVHFVKVNFTASSDGDVKVTNLKFKRSGISSDTDVEYLYLYDGADRLTGGVSISSNYVTFNDASGLFTVSAGTTKTVTLTGDMLYSATSGKTINFKVVSSSDVTTDGAAISGSFPVTGNLMSTAVATDLGRLSITHAFPSSAQTVDPDTTEHEVSRMTFQSHEQELSIEKIVFTEIGSIQSDDLVNFKLYTGGTLVGETASMNSDYELIFDLSGNPFVISKGSSKVMSLRADIAKGSTRTFYFTIQNQYDVLVKDTNYGVYVEPYAAGSWTVIQPTTTATDKFTINSGSLSITRSTTSPTEDLVLDGTNAVIGEWDFRASGENMKVKDFTVTTTYTGTVKGGLDNGKIFVDGVQVGTSKDLTDATSDDGSDTTTTWGFGSTFVVEAGETATVQVIADVKTSTSTSFSGDETVRVSILTSASNVQRMSSLSYQSAISAVNGSAAALSVSAAALTISKYSGYGDQTIIAGTNNAKLGSFVISSGAAENVDVSSITVGLSSAEAATISNLYLKDSATGSQLGDIKVSPSTSNIVSVSFNVSSEGKIIDVYADVKAGSNIGPWNASMTADGTGANTSKSASASASVIQTMTVASTGTLTVTNGSHPDAAILLAGSSDHYVGEFSFNAQNEGFTVSKLKVKVTNNFATSTAGVTLKYTDKNGTAKETSGVFITGSEAYATATFTGLTMYVPKDDDVTLKVYVDLTSIASGATSGANSAVYLDANEGFKATGDAGTSDTSLATSDLNGSTFYVRKSKPTFARLDAGTDPAGGALYKFSVVADASGNIEIKQLGFTVTTAACNVNDLYLYNPNTSTTLTDTTVDPTTEGSSVRLLVGAVDDDVLNISTTEKIYELRGTVTGYGATGDSITVRFKQDTSAVANAVAGTINASDYNVWSDRSTAAHTTATADWTNGFLIKDMTTVQSFSK